MAWPTMCGSKCVVTASEEKECVVLEVEAFSWE